MTQSIRDAAQLTADERVAEHMLRLSELLHAYGQVRWLNMDHSPGVSQADEDAAFDAVISHARALLSASQEDAEHAAMYRWLRERGGASWRIYPEGKPKEAVHATGEYYDQAVRFAMKETK